MIEFFRTRKCKGCAAIQDALETLCIAHETVLLESAQDLPADLARGGPPPVLVDGEDVIHGSEGILAHLEERLTGTPVPLRPQPPKDAT